MWSAPKCQHGVQAKNHHEKRLLKYPCVPEIVTSFLKNVEKNSNIKGKCSGKVQSGPIGLIKKNILLDKKLKVSTRKRMLKNRKVEEKLESTVTSIRTGQKKKEEELCEQEKYRHDP